MLVLHQCYKAGSHALAMPTKVNKDVHVGNRVCKSHLYILGRRKPRQLTTSPHTFR